MASVDPTWALSIIGARVMGPPPIADVWVPLQRGVEALYGLNGAGKTRLLRSIADLYVGRGNGYLVARVVPAADDTFPQDAFTQAFAEPLRFRPDAAWMALIDDAPWKLAGRPGWQESVGEALWSRLWGLKNPSESDDGQSLIRQLDEVLAQGLFALSPLGDGSSWSVGPAVLIDGSTPSLRADADRLLQMASEYFGEASRRVPGNPYATDGEHSEELEEILQETSRGRAAHGDSVITTMTPIFDALRDFWPDYLGQEASHLEKAALVPYRLGGSDVMDSQPVTLTGSIASVTRYDELSVEAANTRTREMMGSTAGPLVEASDGSVIIGGQLADSASDLSMLANLIYADFLADAPDLFIEIGEPETWFNSPPAQWMASDLSGREIGIDHLSEAQRRWALVSISLALDLKEDGAEVVGLDPSLSVTGPPWITDPPSLVLLDEPDAALHATAQRHAVNGLAEVAENFGATIICSTHSREFLNAEQVRLRHVSRDFNGDVAVSYLGSPDRMQLRDLGLQPADLFLLHRVILVVEGSHDEVVIEGLVGDEIAEARTLVIPLRGGRNLASVVDAHILYRFSDAPIIAALDNLRAEQVQAFWLHLLESRHEGQAAFDRVVREHFSNSRQAEETFLINFCRAAAAANDLDRFRVFGFAAADIPEYLPVQSIVPGAESWESLRIAFASQKRDTSFKPWLRRTHGVEITDDLLRAGIDAMDMVPQEFVDLAELCRSLGRQRHPRPENVR